MSGKSPFDSLIESMKELDDFRGPEKPKSNRFGVFLRNIGSRITDFIRRFFVVGLLLALSGSLFFGRITDRFWVEFLVGYFLFAWAVVWLVVKLSVKEEKDEIRK